MNNVSLTRFFSQYHRYTHVYVDDISVISLKNKG